MNGGLGGETTAQQAWRLGMVVGMGLEGMGGGIWLDHTEDQVGLGRGLGLGVDLGLGLGFKARVRATARVKDGTRVRAKPAMCPPRCAR